MGGSVRLGRGGGAGDDAVARRGWMGGGGGEYDAEAGRGWMWWWFYWAGAAATMEDEL